MISLRLRLELLLLRYGWPWIVALLLAAAAGWLHFVATPGLRTQALAERAAIDSLAARLRILPSGDAAPSLVRQRYAAFLGHLAGKESLPGIVRTLLAQARQAGITLQRVDYQLGREAGGDYLAYRISAPVRGTYTNIQSFAEGFLVQVPAAALEEIGFNRDKPGSTDIEARLRFAIYIRNGN